MAIPVAPCAEVVCQPGVQRVESGGTAAWLTRVEVMAAGEVCPEARMAAEAPSLVTILSTIYARSK